MSRRRNRRGSRRRNSNRRRNNGNSSVANSYDLVTPLTKTVHLQSFVGESFSNTQQVRMDFEISGVTDVTSSFFTLPSGFTEWMSFYTKYQVISVNMRVDIANNSTDQLVAVLFPMGTTAITTITSVAEASMIPASRTVNIAPGTGFKPLRMNRFWNLRSLLGRSRTDVSYTGTLTTMPVQTYYVALMIGSADETVNITDVEFFVPGPQTLQRQIGLIAPRKKKEKIDDEVIFINSQLAEAKEDEEQNKNVTVVSNKK